MKIKYNEKAIFNTNSPHETEKSKRQETSYQEWSHMVSNSYREKQGERGKKESESL